MLIPFAGPLCLAPPGGDRVHVIVFPPEQIGNAVRESVKPKHLNGRVPRVACNNDGIVGHCPPEQLAQDIFISEVPIFCAASPSASFQAL